MSTSSARTVNRLLWTAQALAALLFLFAPIADAPRRVLRVA
jgi:hypothetical protein